MKRFIKICEEIINESDVPLNLSVWKEKEKKFLNYSLTILKDFQNRDIESKIIKDILIFQEYLNKAIKVDKYAFQQIDTYVWETNFIELMKDFHSKIISIEYWLEEFKLNKLYNSIEYTESLIKRYIIPIFEEFTEIRNRIYRTIKDYINYDDKEYSFTEEDLDKFMESSKEVGIFIKRLRDIVDGIRELEKISKVIEKWNKKVGPDLEEEKLYHTSIHATKIEKEGFEVNTKVKGLGGETEGKISTTTSLKIAKGISIALKKVEDLANGVVDFRGLVSWCKKINAWEKIINNMVELKTPIEEIGEEETIKMYNQGYGLKSNSNPLEKIPENAIPLKVKEYNNFTIIMNYWIKDMEINDNVVFEVFRRYLSYLEESGRGYNPWFVFVDLSNFRGLDPKDIGIFELEVDIDNSDINYVPGMYEFRVPLSAIKSITRID